MAEKRKQLELKKHVAAIHSSNKLSLLQRKIANALLFNAYDELLDKDEHVIHIMTLCNLIGYDSNDHKTIKRALVNLLATVIEWNLVDGDRLNQEGVWNASSIIADASIKGPVCTYSYSNKMKKLLHHPELYGRLNMIVQAKFQSSYGLALYENCIRYQRIDTTPWFDINQFRKLMGVEENKYKIFRDFKNRVLKKAVEEVNKYSSIEVEPKFKKQGRQVIGIQFSIKSAKHDSFDNIDGEGIKLSQLIKLQLGLSTRQIEEVMSTYDEVYILDKIKLIQTSKSYKEGKIGNIARYFLSALKDDYQSSVHVKNLIPLKSIKKLPSRDAASVESYQRFLNAELYKTFLTLKQKPKKKLLSDFEKSLGKSIYMDIYHRDGLKNILIHDQLCLFIKQNYPIFLENIMSFEEYCSSQNNSKPAVSHS